MALPAFFVSGSSCWVTGNFRGSVAFFSSVFSSVDVALPTSSFSFLPLESSFVSVTLALSVDSIPSSLTKSSSISERKSAALCRRRLCSPSYTSTLEMTGKSLLGLRTGLTGLAISVNFGRIKVVDAVVGTSSTTLLLLSLLLAGAWTFLLDSGVFFFFFSMTDSESNLLFCDTGGAVSSSLSSSSSSLDSGRLRFMLMLELSEAVNSLMLFFLFGTNCCCCCCCVAYFVGAPWPTT